MVNGPIAAPIIHRQGHAVQRWQQRANPASSLGEAAIELREFLRHGHGTTRPRRWTSAEPGAGARFYYWDESPGICVLVRDDVAVTVLSKQLCRKRRGIDSPNRPSRSPRRPPSSIYLGLCRYPLSLSMDD